MNTQFGQLLKDSHYLLRVFAVKYFSETKIQDGEQRVTIVLELLRLLGTDYFEINDKPKFLVAVLKQNTVNTVNTVNDAIANKLEELLKNHNQVTVVTAAKILRGLKIMPKVFEKKLPHYLGSGKVSNVEAAYHIVMGVPHLFSKFLDQVPIPAKDKETLRSLLLLVVEVFKQIPHRLKSLLKDELVQLNDRCIPAMRAWLAAPYD